MSADLYDLSTLYGEREHSPRVCDPEEQRLYRLDTLRVPLEYQCHENPDVEFEMMRWEPLKCVSDRQDAAETNMRLSAIAGCVAGCVLLGVALKYPALLAYVTLGGAALVLAVWIGVKGVEYARKDGEK